MILIEIKQRNEPAYYLQIVTTDLNRELWFLDIKNYLEDQIFPSIVSKNNQHALQRLTT